MRIMIAEDAALLREALSALLQQLGHTVIATAMTADEILPVFEALDRAPDVLLCDVRMPPTHTDDGLRAALAIRKRHPTQPVILLSQHLVDEYVRPLLAAPDAGAGYLLKERIADIGEFDRALRTVAAGGTVIDPEVTRHLLRPRATTPLNDLTSRELEVLRLMADGASNADIAAQLHLSDGAVSKNIGLIFTKLGLQTSDENRRVRAILIYLNAQHATTSYPAP